MQMSSTIAAVCGKQLAQPGAALAVPGELEDRRGDREALLPEVIVVIRWPIRTESGSSIPRLSCERRLVIEQVHLRRGARLEQVDHPLGLGREVRQARQAAVGRRRLASRPSRGRALPSRSSSEPSAIAPRPTPERLRKSRRFDVLCELEMRPRLTSFVVHSSVIVSSRFRMTPAVAV